MLTGPGHSALKNWTGESIHYYAPLNINCEPFGKDVCVERSDEASDAGGLCVQSILTLGTSVYCSVLHI